MVTENINQGDENNVTPIASAAEAGHIEIVKDLAAAGADVNILDKEGESTLGRVERGEYTKLSADTQQTLIDLLKKLEAKGDTDTFHPKKNH